LSASAQWLHNGRRLHLQHGPIDLIVDVSAASSVVERRAYEIATERFQTVLTELVAELPQLRARTNTAYCRFKGSIANRMWRAASGCEQVATDVKAPARPGATVCCGFQQGATTPMIAVAGSVADEVLSAITNDAMTAGQLHKVSVNNGGDIALYLDQSERYHVGVVANPEDARINASIELRVADGIGGIATSGWRGRSSSLGIADSVTVLAANAAMADAAATLIANAVNVDTCDGVTIDSDGSGLIERQPASKDDPDSDLGESLVTTNVARLPQMLIDSALDRGCAHAVRLQQNKIIVGACLFLQGSHRIIGDACQAVERQLADAYAENHIEKSSDPSTACGSDSCIENNAAQNLCELPAGKAAVFPDSIGVSIDA